jgi:hypothetical protein
VQAAIRSGRIAAAVRRDENGQPRIDVEVADALWRENSDPSAQRGEPAPDNDALAQEGRKRPTYADVRAVREGYEARLRALDYEERKGSLVSREAVETMVFQITRAARDAFQALPRRIAGELVATNDAARAEEMLSTEIDRVLTELAHALAAPVA